MKSQRLTSAEIEQVVARMHLQPGESAPEWWPECPVCESAGCRHCDGAGQMHPKREKWLTDALPDAFLITDIAARLLREKEGSKSASLAFVMDIQSAAYEFVKACVRPGETEDDLIKRFAPYS